MTVSYIGIRNSVANLLDKNNVTTSAYDISNGLTKRVTRIRRGRPELGASNTQLPQVFVQINTTNEELNTLGNGSFRNGEYTFNIYPVVQYATSYVGARSGKELVEDELIRLTENILDLVRAKTDLSITGLWVESHSTNFEWQYEESTYVKASEIILSCKQLTQ